MNSSALPSITLSRLRSSTGGVPTAASEGLWMGGQLLEQQANGSKDTKFKEQQLGKAKASYQQLLKNTRTASLPHKPRSGSPPWAVEG